MNEYYFNEAIVLDREPSGEIDNRFSIYAKGFGKIVARGKSTRKITSKLSGHLEPGNLVKVRLIEKNGLQVVDTLKVSSIKCQVSDLYFLNKLLPEHDFDFALWEELVSCIKYPRKEIKDFLRGKHVSSVKDAREGSEEDIRVDRDDLIEGQVYRNLDWRKVLKILGWDPEHGECEVCKSLKVTKFTLDGQFFSCGNCDANLTNFISVV